MPPREEEEGVVLGEVVVVAEVVADFPEKRVRTVALVVGAVEA